MSETLDEQIDALQRMTTSELVERFAELHGYRTAQAWFGACCGPGSTRP